MKNYLIITIGTRDVQLRKDRVEASADWEIVKNLNPKTGREIISVRQNEVSLPVFANDDFPDYFTFSPRLGGKIIDDHLITFEPIVELPLIMPVIDNLATQDKMIDSVMLIYTDQQAELDAKLIKTNHYNNDTLFFKDIITALLKKHSLLKNAVFDEYGIFEKVANIDHQYQHFAEAKKGLLFDNSDEVQEIILLPQGGIDQINHAITLQLIQAFKHKVRLLQKPEANGPIELRFTHQFLNDLNKQKIIKHLEDYDFDKASDLYLTDNWQKKLCQYANLRLSLSLDKAIELTNNFNKVDKNLIGNAFVERLKVVSSKSNKIEKNNIKLKDLIIAFTILCYQKRYNDALIKLFTIFENLFKSQIEIQLNLTKDLGDVHNPTLKSYDINQHWQTILNNIDSSLIDFLNNKGIWINNPNRLAYFHIFGYLLEKERVRCVLTTSQLLNLGQLIEDLSGKRNNIAHRLSSVSETEINKITSKYGYTIDSLISTLNLLVGETQLGIFSEIRDKLLLTMP
jgi:hypothetical protein